uniref:Uncharacterized protein n=1 Tax=Megaviridae environmental sample TaxID=1737588 RepID=A0A5J6VM46_9VIRU|nr:MAG: hypothetical protein [Megaviridae environmental sample]
MKYDLNEKVNLLYSFSYLNDTDIIQENIKINSISIEDYKFTRSTDSELYNDILDKIFDSSFQYINFDKNLMLLNLKKISSDLNLNIQVIPYKKEDDVKNNSSIPNTDSIFSYILSHLVLKKKTKHILLPILNIDIEFQQFIDIIQPYDEFKIYSTAIENKQISNIFSLKVKENFFKSMFLSEYLKNYQCDIRALLFQVIHTLALLQTEHKGFRHNYLNLDSILIYFSNDKNIRSEYTNPKNNKVYFLSSNFDIKIHNFFYSKLPGYYSSEKNIPFKNNVNNYFDLHYFLNILVHSNNINCDNELLKFLEYLIPHKYRSKDNNYYLNTNDELHTPVKLLDHSFFSFLTKKNEHKNNIMPHNYIGNNTRSLIDNKYYRKKINRTLIGSIKKNLLMTGGGKHYQLPFKKYKNNPFISNDNRNVKKRNKVILSKPSYNTMNDKVPENLKAEQKIYDNTDYKPYKPPKEKPTYHPEHIPFNKPKFIPSYRQNERPKNKPNYEPTQKPSHKSSIPEKHEEKKIEFDMMPVYDTKPFDKDHRKPFDKDHRKPFDKDHRKPFDKDHRKPFDKDHRKPFDKEPNPRENNNSISKNKINNKTNKVMEMRKIKTELNTKSTEEHSERKPRYNREEHSERKPRYNREEHSELNTKSTEEHSEHKPRYNREEHSDRKPRYNREEHSERKPRYNREEHSDRKPRYNREEHSDRKPRFDKPNYKPKSEIYATQTFPQNPAVLAEQKIYNTTPPTKPPQPMNLPPPFVPIGDTFYPNSYLPYYKKPNDQFPIQKVYNISLGNPKEHHTMMNDVYEDVLPGNPYQFTMINIFERNQLNNFVRNTMLLKKDGEDMTLQGGDNSLFSYVKLLEFNPYSSGKNPYKTISYDFLLYNAAYPVRYDENAKRINLAKDAMGVNVRIYKMSKGAMYSDKLTKNIQKYNFDVWREIIYYEYIRDHILKNKISPNFISMYLYKLDTKSNIDYEKINRIIGLNYDPTILKEHSENLQNINKLHDIKNFFTFNYEFGKLENVKNNKNNLVEYSGNSLFCITEAPTHNIIQWASPIYDKYGSIKRMIATGYHTPEVWKSIIFQIIYAFSVLQKLGIYFQNVSLLNNVFIKDIYHTPKNIGYWIYKIDNLEFHIPNYGYLVLIDSRFTNINKTDSGLNYKINSDNLYFEKNSTNNYKETFMREFKEMFCPSNFTMNHVNEDNMGSLDEEIIDIISNLHSKIDKNTNLKDLILNTKSFYGYLHNRIGTLLTKSEKDNVSMITIPKFKKGGLVIYQKRFNEYVWAVYLSSESKNKHNIIYKDNSNFIKKVVFTSSLLEYPDSEPINFSQDAEIKYTSYNLIEIYNFPE